MKKVHYSWKPACKEDEYLNPILAFTILTLVILALGFSIGLVEHFIK